MKKIVLGENDSISTSLLSLIKISFGHFLILNLHSIFDLLKLQLAFFSSPSIFNFNSNVPSGISFDILLFIILNSYSFSSSLSDSSKHLFTSICPAIIE